MGGIYDFFQSAYRLGLTALSRIAGNPFRYHQDGLFTIHNADFMRDPAFVRAYRLGMQTCGRDLHTEWRVYVCCWAAKQAMSRDGDFVECGVNTGVTSRAVMEYVSFEKSSRRFYLLDTFVGIPPGQYTAEEVESGLARRHTYGDVYAAVQKTFAPYPNAVLVKGSVPQTLASVPSRQVAYLSIDMNAVAPEIAAAEYFWERLVPGGIVVLDDYGWPHHAAQKRGFDAFAAARGAMILPLPTGQGILIK